MNYSVKVIKLRSLILLLFEHLTWFQKTIIYKNMEVNNLRLKVKRKFNKRLYRIPMSITIRIHFN